MLYDIWDLEEKKEMGARNTVPTRLVKENRNMSKKAGNNTYTVPLFLRPSSLNPLVIQEVLHYS